MRHSIQIQNETMQKFEDYCRSYQKSPFHVAAAALSFAVDGDFLSVKPEKKAPKKEPVMTKTSRSEDEKE